MKKVFCLLATVFLTVGGLTSCQGDQNEMNQNIQSANSLTKTLWEFEEVREINGQPVKERWGSLDFISNTGVLVTQGFYAEGKDDGLSNSHIRKERQEKKRTGKFSYNKPDLIITIPAKNDSSEKVLHFRVDERNKTIEPMPGNAWFTDISIVFRKK